MRRTTGPGGERSDRPLSHPVESDTGVVSDIDEREMLRRMRSGDSNVYETVLRAYGPRVLALARRYMREEADAADCFQDTFLSVFKNIERFQERASLWTWIRSIAINACLMKLRLAKKRSEESIEDFLPVFDEAGHRVLVGEKIVGVEEALQIQDTRELVRAAINKLPPTYRTVLLLRDIEGYSTEEAAQLLRVEVNAVKTRLHRARAALRTILEPVLRRGDGY